MKPRDIPLKNGHLALGDRTRIMGIVNVTPDSFSDGGLFDDPKKAVEHGQALFRQGADVLDVGGESTRPFSDPVSDKEELSRVIPVIRGLAETVPCPISIDTTRAVVAQKALDAGAEIINDVSALRADPDMGRVAAENSAPVVLMHMAGTPKTMQETPQYQDVVAQVREFLAQAVTRALDAGISRDRILIDPGIGFGKTLMHNLLLIRQLDVLCQLDVPVLLGPSRKAFIRKILAPENGPQPEPRSAIVETGTQAVLTAAVFGGVHMVRVHDVAQARASLLVADAIFRAGKK